MTILISELKEAAKHQRLARRRACAYIRENKEFLPDKNLHWGLSHRIRIGKLGMYSSLSLARFIREIDNRKFKEE